MKIAESKVSASLQRFCPSGHVARRTNSVNRLNPVRYSANYFGHKLHIDQNEKLVHFGVTHVIASDGYSGKIVGFLTLPVKNNVAIYEAVYRYVNVLSIRSSMNSTHCTHAQCGIYYVLPKVNN